MLKRSIQLTAGVIMGALLVLVNPRWSLAAEVEGVSLPEEVVQESTGDRLFLNGAGVRKKFIVKVYVGALYLQERSDDPDAILGSGGGKRVTMHFLYKKVEKEKLADTWREGFAANLSREEHEAVRERLGKFAGLFETVHRGDEYRVDYLRGKGTEVRLNGNLVGAVPGEDFYRALLKVWIGPRPADKNLKKALLKG